MSLFVLGACSVALFWFCVCAWQRRAQRILDERFASAMDAPHKRK